MLSVVAAATAVTVNVTVAENWLLCRNRWGYHRRECLLLLLQLHHSHYNGRLLLLNCCCLIGTLPCTSAVISDLLTFGQYDQGEQ